MPPDTTQQNSEVIRRIESLEAWRREREMHQLKFPLDEESIQLLNTSFLRISDIYSYSDSGGTPFSLTFVAEQKGIPTTTRASNRGSGSNKVQLGQLLTIPCVADPSADTITIRITGIDDVPNDTPVSFFTSGTIPGGLTGGFANTYFVVSTGGQRFQVSATLGGAAVNITSAGTGNQFFIFI